MVFVFLLFAKCVINVEEPSLPRICRPVIFLVLNWNKPGRCGVTNNLCTRIPKVVSSRQTGQLGQLDLVNSGFRETPCFDK